MTPIEYIGPVPTKKKRTPLFGGFVILLLPILAVAYFAWPALASYIKSENDLPTPSKAQETIQTLRNTPRAAFGKHLAAAAVERTLAGVRHDGSHYKNIGYPNGDIPADRGTRADVVIRTYRKLGIDLQQLVHKDMEQHYHLYPQLWSQNAPDSDIDHRRVQNLRRYFERHATVLQATRAPEDYEFGDIVIWQLPHGNAHIGIIAPGPGSHKDDRWVVHNNASAPAWNNQLLDFEIIGHYRFQPETQPAKL